MTETFDRRAARTRKALHHALMSLILRKGYEATTIQDIIEEADVGRSTFYGHYTGKEHLLRSGFERLRKELADTQQALRADADLRQDGPLGFSSTLFEHASQYANVYRALVGGRGGAVATNEIRQVLLETARSELPSGQDSDAARELVVQFIVGALLTVLTWWLEKRPTIPPSQVDAMFRQLVLNGVGPSLRAKAGNP